ncbi:Sir2 silent information regulator family NAD-dependent deacetylase [Cloacibacillus sp. An23]|uniref:SIR2 family NAD-dependent protein deacylase n=1 Tax=Cloacibacillus sp. An23 TaxID=1965591 RepID=UPI000B3A4C59|nr:Sir2 silent information regulator family NAD-dependent deacetylase [Cloacibacillus sp. An23]OUO94461.1 Sir2 silent information regulator family NAD-dependent deacetylase [Cloacibacillus sp. An23]
MFSKKSTTTFTKDCCDKLGRLAEALDAAEAVVVGAGAGLSAAAGFDYSGPRFTENFADFIEKYGFTDMYSAGFHRFESTAEHWAFWSRCIYINRYAAPAGAPYLDLLALMRGRDYFVITTNVDHQFQKAGFDKKRLFYTQGDYGLWQCSRPCHDATYDNEAAVRRMAAEQKNMRVPKELIPHCPRCGAPMSMNLRTDMTFVEDEGWRAAAARYAEFLRAHDGARLLFLELGVGGNTPGIIKYPFLRMTKANPRAVCVSVNLSDVFTPDSAPERFLFIRGDIARALAALRAELAKAA